MGRRWAQLLLAAVALVLAALGWLPNPGSNTQVQASAAAEDGASFKLTGRVVRVADGDTFTMLINGKQERIRMSSIDAPEVTKDRERPGQPMAQASRDALTRLISGKTISVQCFEQDRYERNICDVPLDDGMTANQKQVQAGMAWANMEKRGKFMRDSKLPDLEQQARGKRLGIWQEGKPVQPWVWRYQCWQKQQC
ncbi:thermonuclease family protein [Pusillimonas harenae]|uniref:Thermonuclease family protein n=2 Tax=Pollutimonas harenae TaxID=657015 RepID=A0A853GW12_9BURK|nr:thermonuclease family protein [Pollutimonas harenae]NYT86521.1 thermonuclease family protein [Pollutimonas harenae]TEA69994.1 nuclease [Pollutimonas harenae]